MHCWVDCQTVKVTLKNSLVLLQNVKHSYRRPSSSTPGCKPKELKAYVHTKHVYDDHSSIFIIAKVKYSIWLMNGQTMWWNTIWQHKGMKYWYMVQRGELHIMFSETIQSQRPPIDYVCPGQSNPKKQKSRLVCSRSWGWRGHGK